MLVKIFTLSILLFLNPVTFVADRNYYTTEAEKAFRKQKYALASQYYGHVVYDLDSKKDDLLSNLAHAYFLDKIHTCGKAVSNSSQKQKCFSRFSRVEPIRLFGFYEPRL